MLLLKECPFRVKINVKREVHSMSLKVWWWYTLQGTDRVLSGQKNFGGRGGEVGRRDSTRGTPRVGVGERCALNHKLILVFQIATLSTLQEKYMYTVDHDCIVQVMKQELDY